MTAARYRPIAAVALISVSALATTTVLAEARDAKSEGHKSRLQPAMSSHLGSYLAGRMARGLNDTDLAVAFYRKALGRAPGIVQIIERSFLMEATEGNWKAADKAARKLIKMRRENRLARFWLGIAAFKAGRYKTADKHFARAASGPIGDLTSSLARAWTAVATKRRKTAFKHLTVQKQADWSRFYLHYHRALIADMVGNRKIARQNYRRIFDDDPRSPRTVAAFVRHALKSGNFRLAGQVSRDHIAKSTNGGHETVLALFDVVKAGKRADLIVQSPAEGLAEVFYGLGEALTSEGGVSLGTIYLQMALALKPDFPFALASLANVYETTRRYERAIDVYNRIRSGTPLERSIEIRKAVNLNSMDRTDDAKVVLDDLVKKYPKDVRPLEAVGNIMRVRKRYREAIAYYTRLLKLLPEERKQHWTYWYARGTSYERLKEWPNAEKDLLKAMKLDPDQALVLNYLGYSWVDQETNLQRGLKLIEKAVALKPDDGYIVDSLGWAHYRLGRFDEAVKHLERAVELRPEDPILNDHLGDALWRVGRKREARFQWEQALTLKPEKKDEANIRKKLLSGLPNLPGVKAVDEKGDTKNGEAIGKRAANKAGSAVSAPIR